MDFIYNMFSSKKNDKITDDDKLANDINNKINEMRKEGNSRSGINFDDYLPVFLYSHASFSELNEPCKVANIEFSNEVTQEGKFKKMETVDDFFMKVPENMLVVDPIPSGLLCMSGYAVDDLFPWIISHLGSNTFLNKKSLPIKNLKNDPNVEGSDLDILQALYNNRKLYYPNQNINNYRIAFDTNDGGIPWGIRIPIYKNKINGEGWDDGVKYTEKNLNDINEEIKLVHEEFSMRYNTNNNDQCIYLDQVMIKIKEYVEEIYGGNKKIILYLVSCRKQPLQEDMDEDFRRELLNRQLQVDTMGRQNVPKGATTDRKTRGMQTFTYDDDEGYGEMLTKISIQSRPPKKRKRKRTDTDISSRKSMRVVGGKSVKKRKSKRGGGKSVKKNKTKKRVFKKQGKKMKKSVKKRAKKY